MLQPSKLAVCALLLAGAAQAQSAYQVIMVRNPGVISGTVKWAGTVPHQSTLAINKDAAICDPDGKKQEDLDRLIIGPQGGVANTVVYLKDISSGKNFDFPKDRSFLDQKHCHYEPHILLVPESAALHMKSSDAVLHTVHMDGAATFNLPFPFPNQVVSRNMQTPGLVNIKCNGGHVWMNAEMLVAPHPYYAVTDESGRFEMTGVPPGQYQIVAWHEGWVLARHESTFDVLTERRVDRPVFSQPRTWEKKVAVEENGSATVNFVMSEK